MNNTDGKLSLNTISNMCDSTLITILIAILSISCILALLLVIPTTVQYVITLMSSKMRTLESTIDPEDQMLDLKLYELNLYRYRLVFNFSVFLIIVGSSIPLLVHLINVNHQSGSHLKTEETTYEFLVSLWGVCQVSLLLDIGSRLFFAWVVTIPPIIICLFFAVKKSRPHITFRMILIASLIIFILSYTSPIYLIVNLWKKRLDENGTYFVCVSHKRNIFYIRMQVFEMVLCHLLPLVVLVPSILFAWKKMRVATIDLFLEPIIFAIANVPFLIIEIIEQVAISYHYDFSNGYRFANFYMIVMTLYHLSYTCMFLVAPVQSMINDGDGDGEEKIEISNVYQVLIKKKTTRRKLERQFTALSL